MKASMFCVKWHMPLKKNSRGRYIDDAGNGEGLLCGVRDSGAEYKGRASVHSHIGKVRMKARPEQ